MPERVRRPLAPEQAPVANNVVHAMRRAPRAHVSVCVCVEVSSVTSDRLSTRHPRACPPTHTPTHRIYPPARQPVAHQRAACRRSRAANCAPCAASSICPTVCRAHLGHVPPASCAPTTQAVRRSRSCNCLSTCSAARNPAQPCAWPPGRQALCAARNLSVHPRPAYGGAWGRRSPRRRHNRWCCRQGPRSALRRMQ